MAPNGTMLDLTERAPTPQGGLPDGPRGAMEGAPLALPFHLLLGAVDAHVEPERDRVLALVHDLMQASVAQLEALRAGQA